MEQGRWTRAEALLAPHIPARLLGGSGFSRWAGPPHRCPEPGFSPAGLSRWAGPPHRCPEPGSSPAGLLGALPGPGLLCAASGTYSVREHR